LDTKCIDVRTSSWDEGTKAGVTSTINNVSRKVSTLTHSWIKIELLAIHKSHRHHHYGKLLLACVLSKALEHHESHAILHIAGSTSNIAARKLYETFGFVHLPKYEEGGPFERPDGDLYVLGDIGGVLNKFYPWDEML
jgi:GNAT superfamily N-acetyltransferase